MRRRAAIIAVAAVGAIAAPAAAHAQTPGETPPPIPQDPLATSVPPFVGSAVAPNPTAGQLVPRHPFMAPNGRSNIHDDAYMTDTYQQDGPLGKAITRTSTLLGHECVSLTFDSSNRIVAICVGVEGPILRRDPHGTGCP